MRQNKNVKKNMYVRPLVTMKKRKMEIYRRGKWQKCDLENICRKRYSNNYGELYLKLNILEKFREQPSLWQKIKKWFC